MSASKRHHYNPRYYLRRFENEEGALWRLDKGSGQIAKGNNEHFGFKNHWNTLRNPPEDYAADWVERKIADVDGAAAAAISKIINGEFPRNFCALACAMSFMTNNNPNVMQDLEDNFPEQVRDWSEDYKLIAKTKAALNAWPNYVPTFYAIQTISEQNSDLRFLTSSNPVINFGNMPGKFFPISSRHCLYLSYDPQQLGMRPILMECERSTVNEINTLSIRNSWQYVYSCTPDFTP